MALSRRPFRKAARVRDPLAANHGFLAAIKVRVSADARIRLRTAVFRYPLLGRIFVLLDRQTRRVRPTRRTQFVIDGYPRSANSFATVAFLVSNPDAPASHHLHSPVSFRLAVRWGIPMVLLIRDPRAAVASYVQFVDVSPLSAARMYSAYYAAALPLLDQIVVADFDQAIKNFGAVLRECNAKYGTSFHDPDAIPGFYDDIQGQMRGFAQSHRQVPLPSAQRLAADVVLRDAGPAVENELAHAESLYREILRRAGRRTASDQPAS